MRRRTKSLAVLAASFVGLATLIGPVPAGAEEPDTTPPTLHLDEWAHFTPGTTVDATPFEEGGLYFAMTPSLAWQADDPSGICAQELAWLGYSEHWGEPDNVLGQAEHIPLDPAAREFLTKESTNTFDEDRIPSRWVIRATDCAGNTATSGIARVRFGVLDDRSSAISYKGSWKRVADSTAVLDTLRVTKARGASFTTRFTAKGPVGLALQTGPDYGSVQVWVDGQLEATVSAHAAARTNGVIVWEGYYATGTHTLKVVNLATRGRQRMTLDALVLCSGFVSRPHELQRLSLRTSRATQPAVSAEISSAIRLGSDASACARSVSRIRRERAWPRISSKAWSTETPKVLATVG